jgi:hypothetical protein
MIDVNISENQKMKGVSIEESTSTADKKKRGISTVNRTTKMVSFHLLFTESLLRCLLSTPLSPNSAARFNACRCLLSLNIDQRPSRINAAMQELFTIGTYRGFNVSEITGERTAIAVERAAIGQPTCHAITTESQYKDHHLRLCIKTSVAFICPPSFARRYIFSNPVIKQGNMKPSVKMEKNNAKTAAPRKAKKFLNVSDML